MTAVAYSEQLNCSYACEYFPSWLESLQVGCNILLYGSGCKRSLLQKFAVEMLEDEDVLELAAPSSHNEARRNITNSNDAILGSGSRIEGQSSEDNSKVGSSYSRDDMIWELLKVVRHHIARPYGENRNSRCGTMIANSGPAFDFRSSRIADPNYCLGTCHGDSTSNMNRNGRTPCRNDTKEQWYSYQGTGSSMLIEETKVMCGEMVIKVFYVAFFLIHVSTDMLLAHYNWKVVSGGGNQSTNGKHKKINGGAFEIIGDEDDYDEDAPNTGEQNGQNPSAAYDVGEDGASNTSKTSINAAYDNSICRLYIILHNVEDIFPILQEASGASCRDSEHHSGRVY